MLRDSTQFAAVERALLLRSKTIEQSSRLSESLNDIPQTTIPSGAHGQSEVEH
jgi:hypothetical protein